MKTILFIKLSFAVEPPIAYLALSTSLVSMTIVPDRCSHTIRQKSANVSGNGPWNDEGFHINQPFIQIQEKHPYLCGDVRVLPPVAVAVVGVDVVGAGDAVHGLQHHAAVVVGDDVGVPEVGIGLVLNELPQSFTDGRLGR